MGRMAGITGGLIGVALAFAVPGAPAKAEMESVRTRAGIARIVKTGDEEVALQIGRRRIPLEGAAYASIERKLGDLLLVSTASGGNACPMTFVWVHAVPGAIRMTDDFGTCSEYFEVGHDSERVWVTQPTIDGTDRWFRFVYDGKHPVMREEIARFEPNDAPRPPEAWIGHSPNELLTSQALYPRLVSLLGEAELELAQRYSVVSSVTGMEFDGRWIAGSGCMPHNCADAGAAVAIDASGARILIAIHDEDGVRLYGDPGGRMPEAVLEVLRRGLN